MDYKEIMDMLMQELTQQAFRDMRRSDPHADALFKKQAELAEQANGILKTIGDDQRSKLEEYHNCVIDGARLQSDYYYIQGAKDCVILLKKLELL